MHRVLTQWQMAGGSVPFTWADLRAKADASPEAGAAEGAQLYGDAVKALPRAKALLGDAWTQLFGGTDPGVDDIIPHQMVLLLQSQLGCMKRHYEDNVEMDTQAVATFTAIREGAKRHRVQPMKRGPGGASRSCSCSSTTGSAMVTPISRF